MIPSRKRKARITLAVLAAAVLVLSLLTAFGIADFRKRPQEAEAGTTVRFIDVGQGDCTLAVSEGHALLIDTGEYDDSDKVISYLKSLDIRRLDCLILTHPHSDHIGEAADIIEAFEVDRLLIPETGAGGCSFDRLKAAASEKGLAFEDPRGAGFDVGELTVTVFLPEEPPEDVNDCSAVVRLVHGENSFLITGDCGIKEEEQLLAGGAELSADVLKAGHHGSSGACSEPFLEAVRPRFAVISCGAANDYGHPHEETLMRLKVFTDKINTTRDSGTVTFVSDGNELKVYTEKDQ